MKATLTSILGLALLATACGQAQPQGAAPLESAGSGAPKPLVFALDSRLVDGDLKELSLAKDAGGKYTAALRTAFFDRLNGKAIDETTVIASGLACKIGPEAIVCAQDLRPVDGGLTEVKLVKAAGGAFDATLRTAYFDRIKHKEIDATKTLATGLLAKAAAKQDRTYSLDLRPVDGDLVELALTQNGKAFDATLRTAYYDRLNGQAVDQTDTLGLGLACVFAADVRCSRDLRPVDGALTELTLTKDGDGHYAAKLRTAYYDRINHREVDETKDIAAGLIAHK